MKGSLVGPGTSDEFQVFNLLCMGLNVVIIG